MYVDMLRILLFSLLLALVNNARGSHISGGDISYQCVGQDSFLVTVDLYRDCSSNVSMTATEQAELTSTCGGNSKVTLNLVNVGGTEVSQLCSTQLPNSTCNGGTISF